MPDNTFRRLDVQSSLRLGEDPRWEARLLWDRVRGLHAREVGGDLLFSAHVDDASVFVGQLTWAAMRRREFVLAETELRRFFTHPEIDALDWRYQKDLAGRLGLAVLAQGREVEALALFRELLREPDPKRNRDALCLLRNALEAGEHGICPVLAGRGLTSEGLSRFVEELEARLRGRAVRPGRLPRRAAKAELRRILWKTYTPDPNPDPLEHVREAVAVHRRGPRTPVRWASTGGR